VGQDGVGSRGMRETILRSGTSVDIAGALSQMENELRIKGM
jgi:hypothetical protein